METVKISELKKELGQRHPQELIELCLKLVKFKKENKDLLHYLLFEQENETLYIEKVKEEIDIAFSEINRTTFYFAKKGVRKSLRLVTKHIKYSDQKATEIELLSYFLLKFNTLSKSFPRSTAFENLRVSILKKITKALNTLHPDLQHDYLHLLKDL